MFKVVLARVIVFTIYTWIIETKLDFISFDDKNLQRRKFAGECGFPIHSSYTEQVQCLRHSKDQMSLVKSTINWWPFFCPLYQCQQIPCEFQVMLCFTIFCTIGKHPSSHQPKNQMWPGKKYSNGLCKHLNCIPDFLNGQLNVLKNKSVSNSTVLLKSTKSSSCDRQQNSNTRVRFCWCSFPAPNQ